MNARFPIWLLGLFVAALALQALILQQAWHQNPLAQTPHGDAAVYWEWAGEIASGQWQGEQPFQSAPAYPYFLGLLRMLGLGLLGVYCVQALLVALAALLIADAARRRAGPAVGVLAAALFLLIDEVAFAPGRVWNLPLQLFTTSLLLWHSIFLLNRSGLLAWILYGVTAALAVLSNPALLPIAVLLFVLASFVGSERNVAGSFFGAIVMAACIAPVTLHNKKASGEIILLSSQAGVTFAHGNAAGAEGVYHPIPGVAQNRARQNDDALDIAANATGERSWKGTSRYFFGQGLDFFVNHPADALVLEAKKAWWLLTGRYYADLYSPRIESRMDFGSRLKLAPLSMAVIIPFALWGAIRALRRRGLRGGGAEVLLLGAPMLIVLVFWYSPRYRLPMAPAAVLLAAEILVSAWRSWRAEEKRSGPAIAVGTLLIASLAIGQVNRTMRFDHPAKLAPQFNHTVGDLLRITEGRAAEAIPYLESAVQTGFQTPESYYSLAEARIRVAQQTLNQEGESAVPDVLPIYNQASLEFAEAVKLDDQRLDAHFNLASIDFWLMGHSLRSPAEVRARLEQTLTVARSQGNESIAAQVQQLLSQL